MLSAVLLALALQATPSPSPPAAATPPSPSATAPASPLPSSSPSPSGTLVVTPGALNVHPAQTQALTVAGAAGELTANVDNPIVTYTIDQMQHTLTVTAGQQTGSATLTLTDSSGASASIPVRVAYDAGTVPPSVTLQVTGSPVDTAWLQAQIQRAILRNTQLQPGANAQISITALPALLAPGATSAIPVTVQIPGGDQYFDVDATTNVTLQNVVSEPYSPSLLFYDDDPEKLIENGILYRNQVTAQTPVRLYYYHQNSDDPRRLLVVLSVAQGDPASVQVIDASAGPNIDVMTVGHASSRNFLLAKPRNEGVVVSVAPDAPYIADEFMLQRLDGVAGTMGMRVLSGGPVQVTVLAVPPDVSDASIGTYLSQPQLPGDGHHRTGVFAIAAYANDTIAYTVGGPDAQTQYGATTPPSADPGANGHDYGDYGVLRNMVFDITNPTPQPATVYLYESPLGGAVRSSFLVNGTLYELGCARVSNRYQIGPPIALTPNAQLNLDVQTMTDGGSSYPLELGLTAAPPQPQTPAIAAPDGCFPKPQAEPQPSPEPTPR